MASVASVRRRFPFSYGLVVMVQSRLLRAMQGILPFLKSFSRFLAQLFFERVFDDAAFRIPRII